MPRHPHHFMGPVLAVVPLVFLAVWLFNAHRLGWFRKPAPAAPEGDTGRWHRRLALTAGVTLLALLLSVLLFLWQTA